MFYYINLKVWVDSGKSFSFRPIYSPDTNPDVPFLLNYFWFSIFPALLISQNLIGLIANQIRSQALAVKRDDYIRTAYAKGLTNNAVNYRHIFKNVLSPLVGLLTGLIPFLFTTLVLVERVTFRPGLGTLFLNSAAQRDYPVLMCVITLLAFISVIFYLIGRTIMALIDPRILQKSYK